MWIPSSTLRSRTTPAAENKSTAITIASCVLMGTFVIMFLSREAMKLYAFRRFGGDDLLILLATVLGISLSIIYLTLASQGLGVLEPLTITHAETLMKGYYASDFLYISAICFAKLFLLWYFVKTIHRQIERRLVFALGIFTIAWSSASLVAVALQCKLPRPWAMMTLDCYNTGVFWIVYCIIDMTTEVAIFMLSINHVAYLNTTLSRKAVVVVCFAPRLLVVSASLARLIFLYPITPHSNPAFNLWVPVICTQLHVCLSISTACIPYMRTFLDRDEASAWISGNRRMHGMTTNNTYAFGPGYRHLRGHKRGKEAYSMDSTVAMSLTHDQIPDVSPRIPTPAPLSPLIPPGFATPASSKASSRSPSRRGLTLHIPPVQAAIPPSADITSPQTASSYALSPECLSPMSPEPLLSPPQPSATRKPSPPPGPYNLTQALPSSQYRSTREAPSSPDPNLRSPIRSPNLSLFPSPASGRYSLVPQGRLTPRVQKPRPGQLTSAPNYPLRMSSLRRSSSRPRATAKFAVAPNLTHTAPTTAIRSSYSRSPPPQSIRTDPASYHSRTSSTVTRPTSSNPKPTSPQRQRNQRILTPHNSSRAEQISPVSPPTPMTFWREDTSPESAHTNYAETPMEANTPWNIEELPVVRDTRNLPRVIVQRSR